MTQYIIVSKKNKEKGNDKRALFYSTSIGRRRIYRQGFGKNQKEWLKGMKLLTYKSKSYAQKICDEINKAYNDDFKVTEMKQYGIKDQ